MRLVLDLGCGLNKHKTKKGELVIGSDKIPLKSVDIICDFSKNKLPFKNNSFDIVLAQSILEHIPDTYHLLEELYRILKPSGILKIWVPHFSSYVAHMNFEHVKFFSVNIFDYDYPEKDYDKYKPRFKILKKRINYVPEHAVNKFMKTLDKIVTPLVNLNQKAYEKFFSGLVPCDEIYFELQKR